MYSKEQVKPRVPQLRTAYWSLLDHHTSYTLHFLTLLLYKDNQGCYTIECASSEDIKKIGYKDMFLIEIKQILYLNFGSKFECKYDSCLPILL